MLDSFAGSGTTGHAMFNLDDTADRRFILVQQPYDTKQNEADKFNIAAKVTSERIRRVMRERERESTKRVPGSSFTYVTLGDPLFGEYRDFGEKLPKFEEIAKYIFYTETSSEIDLKKVDEKTGLIGSTEAAGGTSYYLFYSPNDKEDSPLSTTTLKTIAKKEKSKNWVIYCEKIWIHPDELRKFEREHKVTVRPMLVPFNLK